MKQYLTRISMFIAGFGLVAIATFAAVPQASAINVFKNPDADQSSSAGVVTNQGGGPTFETIVSRVVTILFTIIGIISVIMIVIGGIRYATSNGDQSAIKSAKNTILYAVIGLVIAMLAFAIVNFVVTEFK